ncbi:hypothetical protein [Devosia ginsengisoli]|uniref:hypothetical protein n=1 Tax=Devosia ginsengisoli TaxID=400770 RepID=UPI0026E9631F|nr:hypothetical protein [Devosia ginsengisoli]MCR6672177.1 HNH endonuclease [Devosia ginsengisoli]
MRRAAIPYSPTEMQWLEANRMMVITDYHRAFIDAFGRSDVSAGHLHALRKRKGWKVGRSPGRYKGRRLKYSDAEIEWLRDNCALPLPDYHRAFRAAFDRPDVTAAKLHSLRKREGFKTGRTGRFEKGQPSPMKGRTCPPGEGGRHPNAIAAQFKKGHVPHTYRGPGHESVDDEGYVWIVIDRPNPWTGAATWRVHKHRFLWEEANGPVPEGMVLKCVGERGNCDPSNWEPVPIGLLPRLNGKSGRNYDQAHPDLKPSIMMVAKIEHRARESQKARS